MHISIKILIFVGSVTSMPEREKSHHYDCKRWWKAGEQKCFMPLCSIHGAVKGGGNAKTAGTIRSEIRFFTIREGSESKTSSK